MTPERLEALRRLAEARKTADLAALRALIAARGDCAAEIDRVLATRGAELAAPFEAAPDQMAARLRWLDHRAGELRARLGELDRRIAAARVAAAVSLGKDEALGELRDRAVREAAQRRATARERDAPPPEERRDENC